MSMPAVEEIVGRLSRTLGPDCGLGGTLKFDFGADGSVLIDGKSMPNSVEAGQGKSAETTIVIALADFNRLLHSEMDPTTALMQGKLRVAGDMSLAMKVDALLKRARG